MDGDVIELVPRATSDVFFDMNGDGIRERTGWVGADDALLAIDENGDELIDGVGELIGHLGRSGFAELAACDGNGDHVIDRRDVVFGKLKLWTDAETDGETDAGELTKMAEPAWCRSTRASPPSASLRQATGSTSSPRWSSSTGAPGPSSTRGSASPTRNDGKNSLLGNAGDTVLAGLGDDDTLDGGGGADMLRGGLGSDIYILAANLRRLRSAPHRLRHRRFMRAPMAQRRAMPYGGGQGRQEIP